ncbi:MAG: hypothetical protein C5B59_17475 [Bacteroidetes bacterium]|nr:MAG: hypothetical protein C5B59_17475 [Bacteroidota bacterium]
MHNTGIIHLEAIMAGKSVIKLLDATEMKDMMWRGVPVFEISIKFHVSTGVVYKVRQGRLYPDALWPNGDSGPMPAGRDRELYEQLRQHKYTQFANKGSTPRSLRYAMNPPVGVPQRDEIYDRVSEWHHERHRLAIEWDRAGRPPHMDMLDYEEMLASGYDIQAAIEKAYRFQIRLRDQHEDEEHQKMLARYAEMVRQSEENEKLDWEHHPDNTSDLPDDAGKQWKIFIKGRFNIDHFIIANPDVQKAMVDFLKEIAENEHDVRRQAALAGLEMIKEHLDGESEQQ